MATVATGVTLAEIARKEGVSEAEAEEMMDGLVDEGVLKKETRDGKTVYAKADGGSVTTQPSQQPVVTAGQSTKFCRQCGAKIAVDSKFCEKCGAQL
jgi:ribosomal protein L40E